MKYIITEEQYDLLKNSSVPLFVRRRANRGTLQNYISKGEMYYPVECDDYSDGFHYADTVIDFAIDEFLAEMDNNMDNEDYYSDVMDYLRNLCMELFGEKLIGMYEQSCQTY